MREVSRAPMVLKASKSLPRRHAAPKRIGFARGVAGGKDSELHHLLL